MTLVNEYICIDCGCITEKVTKPDTYPQQCISCRKCRSYALYDNTKNTIKVEITKTEDCWECQNCGFLHKSKAFARECCE